MKTTKGEKVFVMAIIGLASFITAYLGQMTLFQGILNGLSWGGIGVFFLFLLSQVRRNG